MGGIGKTELATAYANDFAMAYPGGIYWLNLAGWTPSNPAREDEAQSAWLRALEQTIGIGTERVRNLTRDPAGKALPPAAVHERAAKELASDSHYLWILDNVPGLTPLDVRAKILDFIRAPTANGRTLLTTRDARTADGFAEERLDVLSEDDASRLLARFRQQQARAEFGAIRSLVREVGAHTQALILLGENARNNPGGYPRDLERLLETGKVDRIEQIAAQLKAQLGTKARGIVATFELSIDPLDAASQELLSLASLCAPNLAIPDALLAEAFGGNTREDDFGVALAELLRASLLTRRSDKVGAVFIHPLVAAAATRLLEPDALTLRQRVAAALLSRISTARDIRTHVAIADDIQQTRELVPQLQGQRGVQMLLRLGMYEQTRGSFREAEAMTAQGLTLATRVLGEEHPDTLMAMNELAVAQQTQGDFSSAGALQEQALLIRCRVLGEEHPDTLTVVNNLALTLQAQGDLNGARALQEQVLSIRCRVLGEEHPDTLTSMSNLAFTLRAQGDFSGARTLDEQALAICRRALGEGHSHTSVSAWNLFHSLRGLEDLDSARALLERDLLWLVDRDPATLGAHQRQIRENILQLQKTQGSQSTQSKDVGVVVENEVPKSGDGA
jgi:tetratricopeptide (TPR) repeat protein